MATATKKASTPARTPRKRAAAPAPEAHPLHHLIPPAWMDEDYYVRDFHGHSDVDILNGARNVRQNVLLYGETGPGKTSAVYAYAAHHKLPLIAVGCNGAIDPSTLFVRPTYQPDGTIATIETDIVTAMRHGGIILLDEINFMPPRVASVMHGALDKRRTVTIIELGNEAIKLHKDCQIVGTYNPDYEGTKPLNEAFKNRFFIQLEYKYDRSIEEQLVTGIPSLIDMAEALRTAKDNGDIETPTGPNRLLEFEMISEMFSVDFAIENLVSCYQAEERSAVRNWVQHFESTIRAEYNDWMGVEDEDDAPAPTDDTDTTEEGS